MLRQGSHGAFAVEPIAGAEGSALLRGDVLKNMLVMYSPRKQQGAGKAFAMKNMNIVDPLLPTNNLGRSVNRASKARIRNALAHGSRMLNSIFDKVHSRTPHMSSSIITWMHQIASGQSHFSSGFLLVRPSSLHAKRFV